VLANEVPANHQACFECNRFFENRLARLTRLSVAPTMAAMELKGVADAAL
jgi:hypothetical protein